MARFQTKSGRVFCQSCGCTLHGQFQESPDGGQRCGVCAAVECHGASEGVLWETYQREHGLGPRWDTIEADLAEQGAGAVQLREMRKAFYLGAAFLFDRMLFASNYPHEKGAEILDQISEQLHAFEETVK